MKYLRKVLFFIFLFFLLFAGSVRATVAAGPHLTLSPTTATAKVGETLLVTLGVDTLTQKTIGVDLVLTFDTAKLTYVSSRLVADPSLQIAPITPIVDSTAGTMKVQLGLPGNTLAESVALSGSMIEVTFQGKVAGVASINYTCSSVASDFSGSNIVSPSSTQLIDCPSNSSGSYTVSAASSSSGSSSSGSSSSSSSSDSSTNSSTGNSSSTTGSTAGSTTGGTLPKTGVETPMIILLTVGGLSVLGAFVLRWL